MSKYLRSDHSKPNDSIFSYFFGLLYVHSCKKTFKNRFKIRSFANYFHKFVQANIRVDQLLY